MSKGEILMLHAFMLLGLLALLVAFTTIVALVGLGKMLAAWCRHRARRRAMMVATDPT